MPPRDPPLSRRRHAPKGPLKQHDHMDGPDHRDTPRCTARAKGTGQRCKRRPIPGGSVCVKHGGGAPQVKDAARDRLRAMVYPALAVYAELLDEVKFPTVRFATAREIVNHEFGKPGDSDVNVNVNVNVEVELLARLERGRQRNANGNGSDSG